MLWGWLADLYGRRASILLSAVMFVGTSICGAMPSLWWNVGMCFLMGAAAGGMLPVTYALLAETMPSKQRGWALVLVGGLGAVGGYLAASALLGVAGADLQLAHPVVPQPADRAGADLPQRLHPRVAQVPARARPRRARRTSCCAASAASCAKRAARAGERAPRRRACRARVPRGYVAQTVALSIAALAWGLINFGLLLWMPAHLVAKGYSMARVERPAGGVGADRGADRVRRRWLYSRWSSKGALVGAIALCGARPARPDASSSWRRPATRARCWSIALLIVGINGIIAMLLPYAAESYPLQVRGRATGWVAACTKAGGLAAQLLSLLGLVPGLVCGGGAGILVPVVLALVLVVRYGAETRGRDLRDLEGQPG